MRKNTAKRGIVRGAWSIARTYWASEEKWSAWGLLLAVVALNLGTVCTSVGINAWNPGFLQRATGIRPRSNLPAARYLFRFRRSWHHAVGLRGLFATDAADSLATLADPKISERLAGKPRVLPAAVEEWSG
jgi:ABC-type uncharacterized transport system fused permease/ATPase subunit